MARPNDMFNPDPVLVFIGLAVSLAFALFQLYSVGNDAKRQKRRREKESKALLAEERLLKHSEAQYGQKKLVRVDGDIFVAVGYGVSNCILITGVDGCVVLGASDSESAAKEVLGAFRAVTDKPIVAVILSHFHPDHVSGLQVFASASKHIQVFVHKYFEREHANASSTFLPVKERRRRLQSGAMLKSSGATSVGNGIGKSSGNCLFDLTDAFDESKYQIRKVCDRLTITVAGLELQLIHSPGESDDHIMVWWPDKRTLFPGKNFYKSFPDVYGLEGGYSRSCKHRVQALTDMLKLRPEVLIPEHTRPLVNKAIIEDYLIAQRDAIQFLHDQTVRLMNKGLYPDEISHEVSLPPHLANHPCLQEFHGCIEATVRGVFNHYMGWFSGDPVDLHPLTPAEEARHVIALAGGPKRLVEAAEEALQAFEFQRALVLCEWLRLCRLEEPETKALMSKTLLSMVGRETSALTRNWLLSEAKEAVSEFQKEAHLNLKDMTTNRIVAASNLEHILRYLRVAIDPLKSAGMQETIALYLTDVGQSAALELRNGTLQVCVGIDPAAKAKVIVRTTFSAWKQIVCKQETIDALYMNGDLHVEPNVESLSVILNCFDL